MELEVAPFSLQDALERGVVDGARTGDDGRRPGRRSHANGGLDVVAGDERRIRQVIFNLLSNAVKFTPAGGPVDVSAARVNGEVSVSVADTGPGIAAEDLDRIFEEFQQTEVGRQAARGDRSRPRALETLRRAARRPDLGARASSAREARSCSRCR